MIMSCFIMSRGELYKGFNSSHRSYSENGRQKYEMAIWNPTTIRTYITVIMRKRCISSLSYLLWYY